MESDIRGMAREAAGLAIELVAFMISKNLRQAAAIFQQSRDAENIGSQRELLGRVSMKLLGRRRPPIQAETRGSDPDRAAAITKNGMAANGDQAGGIMPNKSVGLLLCIKNNSPQNVVSHKRPRRSSQIWMTLFGPGDDKRPAG